MINEKVLLDLKKEFQTINIVNFAKHLESFDIDSICDFLNLIGTQKSAEIFAYLNNDIKEQIILKMNKVFIYELIEYLYSDDIKEFLDECSEEVKEKMLSVAPINRLRKIIMQMNFKENSAGALMSIDFVEIAEDDTTYIAMEKIKSQEKIAETISYCYVTNNKNVLVGVLSMKDILLAPENTIVSDIMETDIISVNTKDDQEFVAKQISKYDLLAIPVVNDQYQILGIMTIDDVLDIVEDEITEDIIKMGGVSPTGESYLEMNTLQIAKSRIFWLLILMVSATISGTIISKNIDITLKLPSLIIFMPMLMDTAGNAGSQSSAMVIRGIIVDNLTFKDMFSILKKEFLNSLLLGLCLFIVNMLRIMIFMPQIPIQIGFLVSITIYIIVTIANLVGGFLPLVASKFKLDPTSMSGPVLTTFCDAISLTIYFTLASIYLGGVI